MTGQEWLAVIAVLAGLMIGLPGLSRLCRFFGASAEVSRKSVHVAMGATCVCFFWIFSRPLPVWILAGLAILLLLLLRTVPSLRNGMGSALHGVKRLSYGEILFAPAVALVFQLSQHNPLLYIIPVNILTVADAAGAIAGTHWGRRLYVCGTGKKSIEGSIAFLLVAFFCSFLPLWFSGQFSGMHAVGISATLAILAMMAEGISDQGFDNLVIPLGCHFLLARLLITDGSSLAVRFVAAGVLLAIVMTGARWSSLTGSALIGAALLGYGCAVLADWRFLLPPLAVFLCHLFTTRRHRLKDVFDHRLDAVISHAIACLPWVLAVDRGWFSAATALAGISISMAVELAFLDAATQLHVHGQARILRASSKGWLIAGLPGLIWLVPKMADFAAPLVLAILITPGACFLLQKMDRRSEVTSMNLWMLKGLVALLVGSLALFSP